MENQIIILSLAIIILIIILLNQRGRYKEFQIDITRQFDKLRHSHEKLKYKKRNEKIIEEIRNLKNELFDNNKSLLSSNNRIEELKTGISEKDKYFQALKYKSNESISKITSLYSDFLFIQYELSAQYLETKSHPAKKEAKRIREIKNESKILKEQHRQMLYKYEELLQLFPELVDYVDDFKTIQELDNIENLQDLKEDYDRVREFVSKEEYLSLTVDQRNQLALNRYLNGRKSNWQIGRDYEMYCGQVYEKEGWDVIYFGIEKKLEDLGRDLIAKKNNEIHIIQCKYWSKSKVIREKHIMQLYGSTVEYSLNKDKLWKVIPVFITNTDLSETAIRFAQKLGVKIIYKELKEFPRIKCNINKDEYGLETRIYHLPFDQQYDRTKITNPGESYAMTVEEAVSKGFRRAYRYFGN